MIRKDIYWIFWNVVWTKSNFFSFEKTLFWSLRTLNSVHNIFLEEVVKQSFLDNYEQVLYIELENKGLLFTFAPKGIGNHTRPHEHKHHM